MWPSLLYHCIIFSGLLLFKLFDAIMTCWTCEEIVDDVSNKYNPSFSSPDQLFSSFPNPETHNKMEEK